MTYERVAPELQYVWTWPAWARDVWHAVTLGEAFGNPE